LSSNELEAPNPVLKDLDEKRGTRLKLDVPHAWCRDLSSICLGFGFGLGSKDVGDMGEAQCVALGLGEESEKSWFGWLAGKDHVQDDLLDLAGHNSLAVRATRHHWLFHTIRQVKLGKE